MTSVDEKLVVDRCEELVAEWRPDGEDGEDGAVEFLGRQFDLGLAWIGFPPGCGGLGLDPSLQRVVDECVADAGAPDPAVRNPIGHGMAAPVLITYGSADQQRRYLRRLFTAEDVWCQLFSEPGAGSDIASLSTRAVRDGDEWVVDGQKVWTSYAHSARWGLLVTRTDPDVPKHKGMTYFVLDMHAPGVEVRPLFQLTGDAEFNEVYLTGVRVPDAERLGGVGDGWRVVLTTLMNERVAVGGQVPPRGAGLIADAVQAWHEYGPHTAGHRDEMVKLWVEAEVLRLTNIRAAQARHSGGPGPEGSIGKVMSAEFHKRVSAFTLRLLGAEGMLKPDGYPMARPERPKGWGDPARAFLRARAQSIEGGTTEIAKNILAERVLGLPGDARVDKDVPWRDVPRS